LIEVIESHQQEDIIETLKQQSIEVRAKVEEVSVDMWGGFPKVVKEVFPNAVVVIDRFHVMKAVNEELNKIRRQAKIFDRGSKFLLLKNGQDLTPEETEKLELILQKSKRLEKAYRWKEEFRAIYEQPLTVEEGKRQIQGWLDKARAVYREAITTIRNHLDGISNYFRNRTTSGAMEGINNRIKLIKRQAYGFVNFNNFRERLSCLSFKFPDRSSCSKCFRDQNMQFRSKTAYSIYYPDFSAFKEAITVCLNQCHTTYKQELDSLLTLRFQSFKKVKAIT